MNLTTRQAAEKLEISMGAVRRLIRDGELTDVKVHKEGLAKHYPLIDSKQVVEYLKAKREAMPKRNYVRRAGDVNGNGHEVHADAPATAPTSPHTPDVNVKVTVPPMSGFKSQLDRIESKLDQLLKLWS